MVDGRWPALATRVKNNQERCLNKTKQANNPCQSEIVALGAYVPRMENPQPKKADTRCFFTVKALKTITSDSTPPIRICHQLEHRLY